MAMCCDSGGGGGDAPDPKETEFSKTMAQIMAEQHERGKKFYPLEDKLIAATERFQTPAYSQEQVGMAKSDMASAFANQRSAADHRSLSLGINPADPRSSAMDRGMDMAEAASTAGAGTMARRGAEETAYNTLAGVSGRGDAKINSALNAANSGSNAYLGGQRNQMGWNEMQQNSSNQAMQGLGSLAGSALMFF